MVPTRTRGVLLLWTDEQGATSVLAPLAFCHIERRPTLNGCALAAYPADVDAILRAKNGAAGAVGLIKRTTGKANAGAFG
jgi:hypothetical protein